MSDDPFEQFRRQFQSASQEAARAVRPFLEQQEQITRALQPLFDQQEAIRRHFELAADVGRQIRELMAPMALQVADVQRQLAPLFEQTARAFDDLPPRNREALLTLAKHGWYLDPEMPLPSLFEAARLLEGGQIDEVYATLCDHFDARSSEIEKDVCARFPQRADLFKLALAAHHRGEYGLSIPLLLAQADGICQETLGVQLYSRRSDGLLAVVTELQLKAGPFRASLLSPLVEPTPLSAGAAARKDLPDALNRHAILHGESCNYGTRVNGCRTISLLVYVVWMLAGEEDGAA